MACWWPCCDVPCEETDDITCECHVCPDGMPRCWEMVAAGITNQSCAVCDVYNGTFILEFIYGGAVTPCTWYANTGQGTGCGMSGGSVALWRLEYHEVSHTWRLVAQSQTTSLAFFIADTDDFSCTDANVIQFDSEGLGASQCQTWPSSITIQPATC